MSPKDIVQAWNESHERIPLNKEESRYAIEKEGVFRPGSHICDLGGGTGADAMYFIQQGHSVTLVDISDYALKVARSKLPKSTDPNKLDTKQADFVAGTIPLPDKQFDIVYSRLALHYFDTKTTLSLFKGIARILKDGGVAYVTLKSPKDTEDMKVVIGEASEKEPGVFVCSDGQIKSRFTPEQLQEMLTTAGITNFKVHEYIENLGGTTDVTKSGLEQMIFNEVIINK